MFYLIVWLLLPPNGCCLPWIPDLFCGLFVLLFVGLTMFVFVFIIEVLRLSLCLRLRVLFD